ncbi:MAG TPA: hypothetical protein VMY34_04010, partial [Acidimicrobiales bacterium]|nr:hypothetical protein [Acidimicrobiales bacterium]
IVYNAPPCAPKWAGGDNGGATYTGVTATELKFFMMQCQPNEQVDAILATQGLAATDEEVDAMGIALVDFMNKYYEFYGRKLTWERAHMDCPTTPPDPAKARQAGVEVAKKHPFAVYAAGGGSATADALAQNGILTVGTAWNGREFYAGRRPYRWDIFPNSTESADWMVEYYCKKLAKGTATNAGRLIHPTIGGRDTPRKLGIIVPDDGTGTILPAAKGVAAGVKGCTGQSVPIFTYQSDINRAQEQTRVTVAGLIDAKVTTVTCMCDPIAPVFLTNGLTQNNYYPEHWMAGLGLLDYDVLGRLYDPAQWNHAFGISQLSEPIPFEETDAAKVWRATGHEGNPCAGCNLLTGYMLAIGQMIQSAGPNLNPLTVEQALVGNQFHRGGWAETGGQASVYLIRYGPEDYNSISDFREAYWDATATSKIDGKQGAYISMNKGRRYAGGELDNSFTVPAKPN